MNISKIIAAGALATSLAVAQEDAWPTDEQTDASTSSAAEAVEQSEEQATEAEEAEPSSEAAEPQSETTAQTASEPAPAASEQADTRTAYDSGDNAYAENTASAPQKTNTLNSKMGVGAHIDFNYSFLNGLAQDWNMGDETDAPAGFGFDAGIRGRIPMVDYLQFVPELNFHFAALTQSDEAAERVFKQMDLEIPLTMRATILDMLYIAAGVQLTLNLSSKVTFEEEDIDMGGGLGTTSMEFNEKIEQAGFTFGLLFGAGFFIMERLSIDAAFMLGLSDMYPDCESDLIESMDGGKQMTFKVGVGYWFM